MSLNFLFILQKIHIIWLFHVHHFWVIIVWHVSCYDVISAVWLKKQKQWPSWL